MDFINTLLNGINGFKVVTNAKGDRVEQKQARSIKSILVDGLAQQLDAQGYEIMYDNKSLPVIVLDNGVIIGFDFVVRKLDTELFTEPSSPEPK